MSDRETDSARVDDATSLHLESSMRTVASRDPVLNGVATVK